MKKIVLVLISAFAISWAFSQSLEIYYEGDLMDSMTEITFSAHPDSGMMAIDSLDVKNISEMTLDVICVREILENVEGSENSFCWGSLCYPPYVDTSSNPTTIEPLAVSYEFIGDYDPKGLTGTTKVKYTFYDIENPEDKSAIIVNYDASDPNSIVEYDLRFQLSKAYPNPANNSVSVDYNLRNIANARIAFYNLLGSKVKEVNLTKSVGTSTINTSDFIEGIYFYTLLVDNEALQTQKLIIKH